MRLRTNGKVTITIDGVEVPTSNIASMERARSTKTRTRIRAGFREVVDTRTGEVVSKERVRS